LCDRAEKKGINLCYENVHWSFFSEPEFYKQLKPKCPKLACCLDVKQAMQAGIDYKKFLDVMENLKTVHLCDYDNQNNLMIPSEKGSFDFVELFRVLKDKGFDGNCFLEVYQNNYKTFDELKNSYEYLLDCLEKAKLSV
ncbi:MAG: sugar phosphate isomerase/epimerase, partial [Clostridia bacterium]